MTKSLGGKFAIVGNAGCLQASKRASHVLNHISFAGKAISLHLKDRVFKIPVLEGEPKQCNGDARAICPAWQ